MTLVHRVLLPRPIEGSGKAPADLMDEHRSHRP